MRKLNLLLMAAALMAGLHTFANDNERMLWGSINARNDASASDYKSFNNIILLSWRKLPGDPAKTGFDLYRSVDGGAEKKLNDSPIEGKTNWQDKTADRSKTNTYRLTISGTNRTIGRYTMPAAQASAGEPYIQIDLKDTKDVCTLDNVWYEANDVSVGDLDGDGMTDIVVKRLLTQDIDGTVVEGTAATESPKEVRHTVLYEAYRLDGTFLWRICSGPNIMLGNSSSFAIADFDGDGRCEMAIKTGEGTVFGDGQEIGDTDGDGMTDYREDGKHYIGLGPEFFSIVDGLTGGELARADYITRGRSEEWGDDYFKRASSLRVAVANVSGGNPSVLICRGIYERSVLEAWDYRNGQLTRRWHFDSHATGKGKDGKSNLLYAAQGFHSLSVGDVDGDGMDEVVYGSMTIDHDGQGLYTSEYGHGDALHLGKFDPNREGLQIWSCQEFGQTMAVLRDARNGATIWKMDSNEDNDTGRAMIADIDPTSPGCEMWWFRSNAYSINGQDLGYQPTSCNMAIWFGSGLNRQLYNETSIHQQYDNKRIFTLNRYDVTHINGTKGNPAWYGDILGDWREEVIMPDATRRKNLKVFATWYPTDYAFPWLMTDHVYQMSALNQNVGYNMPTQLGYYLGSDLMEGDGVEVTIGPAGYATFANNTATALALPEGVKAYGVSDFSEKNVTFTEYNVIPADIPTGVGVILKGKQGSYTLTPTSDECTYDADNYLVAVTEDCVVPEMSAAKINYIFANKSQGIGFYKSSGEGTIAKGLAYLSIPYADNRKWDFSQKKIWSDTTIANLEAERTTGNSSWKTNAGSESSGWRYMYNAATNTEEIKANGVTIAETAGLYFRGNANRVGYDCRSTNHFYLAGNGIYLIVPNLKANSTITISTQAGTSGQAAYVTCDSEYAPRTGATNVDITDNVFTITKDGSYEFQPNRALYITAITISSESESPARYADFFALHTDGEQTGVNGVMCQTESENQKVGHVYNLAGQRIGLPIKGLYIVNGKKRLVK